MKKKKTDHLGDYLSNNELTTNASKLYKKEFDFTISSPISQRKMIDLGKVIARVVTVNDLLELNNEGFSQQLTDNSVAMVRQEIVMLLASLQHHKDVSALGDIGDNSDWMKFA